MRNSLIALSIVTGLMGGAAYASLDSLMAVASCQVSGWIQVERPGVTNTQIIGPGYTYPSGTSVFVIDRRCVQGQVNRGQQAPNFMEYRVRVQGQVYIWNAGLVTLR